MSPAAPPCIGTGLDPEEDEDGQDERLDNLEQAAESLASQGLRVRWELLRGVPGASVTGLARELSNNMVALASHGRSGLARWVQGSVAEDLIRNTGDPVLVIPVELATKSKRG